MEKLVLTAIERCLIYHICETFADATTRRTSPADTRLRKRVRKAVNAKQFDDYPQFTTIACKVLGEEEKKVPLYPGDTAPVSEREAFLKAKAEYEAWQKEKVEFAHALESEVELSRDDWKQLREKMKAGCPIQNLGDTFVDMEDKLDSLLNALEKKPTT